MRSMTRFLPALIPLLAACLIGLTPQPAGAQPGSRSAPEITGFQVDMSDQLAPGSEVDITLEGTPGGRASVRLTGVKKTIVLREVDRGVYEGSYTVSRRDRPGPQPAARATLRVRKFSVVATQALAGSPPPVLARPAPLPPPTPAPAPPPPAAALAIERFTVVPVARIEPGA